MNSETDVQSFGGGNEDALQRRSRSNSNSAAEPLQCTIDVLRVSDSTNPGEVVEAGTKRGRHSSVDTERLCDATTVAHDGGNNSASLLQPNAIAKDSSASTPQQASAASQSGDMISANVANGDEEMWIHDSPPRNMESVPLVESEDKFGGPARRESRACLISLRVGVFLLVAIVISAAGFCHLATLSESNKPVEEQGILTYRSVLGGAGQTVIAKLLNELGVVTELTQLAYLLSGRVPYNVTEDPSANPTWDFELQKWFLGQAALHPERRFCYVDAGSWSWTCQQLRGSVDERFVGTHTSFVAHKYTRNTTGSAVPLRYDYNGPQAMPANPTEIVFKFLATNQVVFLMTPFLDFTGFVSYAFAIHIYNPQVGLAGVLVMYIPVEDFITTTSLVYSRSTTSCSKESCSATFDGSGGVVVTTVPIDSIYVDPSTPGAACLTNPFTTFTRCRHSRLTLSKEWPQLATVLQDPSVLAQLWYSFKFKFHDEYYLSTSGNVEVSFENWLSLVIAPADNIFGAYFKSRDRIIYAVVGACLASCIVALVVAQIGLSRVTTTLDDMTFALALRSRTQDKGEFLNRREARSAQLIGFTEIQAIDNAIVALDAYLDSLGAMLPSAVLASMRKHVAKLRRAQRQENKRRWGCFAFIFSSAVAAEGSNSDISEQSELSEHQEQDADFSPNTSFDEESILIAGMRLGSLSETVGNSTQAQPATQVAQPLEPRVEQQSMSPVELEFATEPDSGSAQFAPDPQERNGATTVDGAAGNDGSAKRPTGILQPSTFQSVVFRRKGIFASVSLACVVCDTPQDFQHLLTNIMTLNWSYKGEFEGFSYEHFLFSFGCYEDTRDAEVCACSCALNMLRGFQQWCIASEGRIRGKISVAIDAGRYEDVTLVACANTIRPIRTKIITTAARYSVERLNVLCDILNEPLVITEEVKKNLKLVTSVIDNVRFAPTCMPRLSRRGDVRLYRVEMKSASAPTPPITLQFLKNDFHEAFKKMMAGNFIEAHNDLMAGHQRCLVLNYSSAARRFVHYCKMMIQCGKGRPGTPARGGGGIGRQRCGTMYFRGEMQEWFLQGSEVEYFKSIWDEADGATARQHFGAVLHTE